jgi:hypothetical protein
VSALQLETELSRQRHDGDLKEKYRLSRMLENKVSVQYLCDSTCHVASYFIQGNMRINPPGLDILWGDDLLACFQHLNKYDFCSLADHI